MSPGFRRCETGRENELGKVGVQPHVAVFGLENVRELVEALVLWELAVDRVVLFAVWATKEKKKRKKFRRTCATSFCQCAGLLNSNMACRASTCTSTS